MHCAVYGLLYHFVPKKSILDAGFSILNCLTQKKRKFALYRLQKMCYNKKIENNVASGRTLKDRKG